MEKLTIEQSVDEGLVYIGAAPNRDIWQRLGDRKGNPDGNHSQEEKDLTEQGIPLEFSYAVIPQDKVRSCEATLLRAYEAKHGAKPPGNTNSAHASTVDCELEWSKWHPLEKENGVYRVRIARSQP